MMKNQNVGDHLLLTLPPASNPPPTPYVSGAHIPPSPVYKWTSDPHFFDGIEDDQVDTTLTLRPPGTSAAHIPPSPPSNPTPPRWLRPDFFDGVEEDVVDTTLSLRPPGTTTNKSTKPPPSPPPETSAAANIPQLTVTDATPLRWAFPAATSSNESRKKRRQDEAETSDHRRRRRRIINEEEDGRPLIPIQGLLQAIELRGGSRPPVFLYRKKLENSDVSRQQNRLLVTRSERVMAFLREEEAAALVHGRLEIVGVDGGGNVYQELVLKNWASLGVTVINDSDWKNVVANNNAEKGDVLEIWGYRENHKACLAFNFRSEGGRERDGAQNYNQA